MPNRVKIVTDSICDLPKDLIAANDIRVVPIYIKLDNVSYRDGVDISPSEIYKRQKEQKLVISTSSPSPGDFKKAFEDALQDAESILTITISSSLTGVYQNARIAASLVPNKRIEVFDTQTATVAQGLLVLKAAALANKGCGIDEIIERLENFRKRVKFVATIEEYEYVHRSGRVPWIAAFMASALNIKPVFEIKDGVIKLAGKTISRDGSLNLMCKILAESFAGQGPIKAMIMHALAHEDAEMLKAKLQEQIECEEVTITEATPVIGAYTGPGLLGVGACAKSAFEE